MRMTFPLIVLCAASLVSAAPPESKKPPEKPGGEPARRTISAWSKSGNPSDKSVRLIDDLAGFKPQPKVQLDEYGGWTGRTLKATGFFRVEKTPARWWMVDPLGHPFFDIAATSVNSATGSPTIKKSFETKYKDAATWREATLQFLRDNGFNGTGAFCDDAMLAQSPKRMPYTPNLNFMSGYGHKRGGTFAAPGHTGYPNDCIFVFDPEFESYCDERAKSLVANKIDPYLVGYFSDNEMPFRLNSLDLYLKNDAKDPGGLAAEQFMAKRGKAKSAEPTDEDRQAWMEVLADRYFSIVAKAIRQYDPNHLYMGARFHSSDGRNEALFRATGRHVDVISYNLYGVWTPTEELIGKWANWSGRPILITEFYAKGQDSGMPNSSGAGWTVPTQRDRGWFYQNFVLGLIESKACVGWHWLRYIDNAMDDKRADPSNGDSNKGLVNTKFEPYTPMLESMKRLNLQTYPLAQYFDGRS